MQRDGNIPGGEEDRADAPLPPGADPGEDEPADEELLVLSVPPPSPRQVLFILAVLVLSCFMLIWFFPDLKYLLRGLGDPRDLGEAADLDSGEYEAHSFVRLRGIPMTNRTLVFSKGVRWFRDTERKIFPLAGRPELLVEWRVPEEQRAYRDLYDRPDSARLPFEFEGRLVPRKDLGERYERIWLFHYCLASYSGRECRLCLGAADLDDCRRRIACALEIGEDCRAILSDPGDGRNAAVRRKEAELALDEARRLHASLSEMVGDRRRGAAELERDLADLESGRMATRIEGEIAGWRERLERTGVEEKLLLERIGREHGRDPEGLRADAERTAALLEETRVEIRELVRRAAAERGDAGTADAGAAPDIDEGVVDRLEELEARRDDLQRRLDLGRGLLEELRELKRQAGERGDLIADLEASLAEAQSGAMRARLEAERDRRREAKTALEAGAARLEEIGGALAAAAPGEPAVAEAIGELRRLQRELAPSRWVLIDGQVPVDSLWVVAVYVIFLLMIVSNLRHLYRFWAAWRA